jgi:hypothetical protein
VKLLRDLVLHGQERKGLWSRQPDLLEHLDNVGGETLVRISRAPDLVATKLETNAASRSGVKRLAPSPTRIFIAVPPLITPAGSIWPTTVLATALCTRCSVRPRLLAKFLMRSASDLRFGGAWRI